MSICASKRIDDPALGPVVYFKWMWGDDDNQLTEWCENNIGNFNIDFGRCWGRHVDALWFKRPEDADLCYLAWAS